MTSDDYYDEQYEFDEQLDAIEEAEGDPRLQGYMDIHRTPEETWEFNEINRMAEQYPEGKERGYTMTFNSTGNRAIVWLTPHALNQAKRFWKIRPLTEEDRFILGIPQYNEYTDDTMVEVKYPNPNEARRREYRSHQNPGSQQRRDRGQGRPHRIDPRSGQG